VTADRLTDSSSGATQYVQQTGLAIPAASASVYGSVFVRKTTGATNTFGVQLYLSGGTATNRNGRLNTNSGNALAHGPGAGTVAVEDYGDWWRLTIICTNDGSNNTARLVIVPATGTNAGDAPGGRDVAATGSAIVWGAQVSPDSGQYYIPTGSTVPIWGSAGDSVSMTAAAFDVARGGDRGPDPDRDRGGRRDPAA
jgi:hypothetical protein